MTFTQVIRNVDSKLGKLRAKLADETGAVSSEYAVATVGACGFGSLLGMVLKSDIVQNYLFSWIGNIFGSLFG